MDKSGLHDAKAYPPSMQKDRVMPKGEEMNTREEVIAKYKSLGKFYSSLEWFALKQVVTTQCHNACAACKKRKALTIACVFPRKDYPEYEFALANLQALCFKCERKHRGVIKDFRPAHVRAVCNLKDA